MSALSRRTLRAETLLLPARREGLRAAGLRVQGVSSLVEKLPAGTSSKGACLVSVTCPGEAVIKPGSPRATSAESLLPSQAVNSVRGGRKASLF